MSESAAVEVVGVAAPMALFVLLVAGVSWLALRGAGLLADQVTSVPEVAGASLGPMLRQYVSSISATQGGVLSLTGTTHESGVFTMPGVESQLRGCAREALATEMRVMTQVVRLHGLAGATSAATVRQIARSRAMIAAVQSHPMVSLVAGHHDSSSLQRSTRSVDAAVAALRRGDVPAATRLAVDAERTMADVTRRSLGTLAAATRATVTAQAAVALENRGYEVGVAHRRGAVALVGRRGERNVAVVSKPGGGLTLDMAGFDGHDCQAEMGALLQEMRRLGLSVEHAARRRHGRFGGGALISAARSRPMPLEQALAELATHRDDPVSRRTALTGSAPQQAVVQWLFNNQTTTLSGGEQ